MPRGQVPLLNQVWVVAQDPDGGGLIVSFKSGQLPGFPIRMGYWGPADGQRVKHPAMPGRGTWGLAAFPGGDIRNGVWLCSIYANQVDALTAPVGDPFQEYDAHLSGYWRLLDGAGQEAVQWPDGSYLVIASGTILPTTFRHIVDQNQVRQRIAFTRADRIPSPPTAYQFTLNHQSGTNLNINGAGALSLSVTGAMTLTSIGAVLASGLSTCTLQFGGTTVEIDATGNVIIKMASGATFQLTQGALSANDFLPLVSKLISAFNSHVHSGVTTGGGNTGAPTSNWASGTIGSAIAKISN